MAILKPTEIYGEILFLGVNSKRDHSLESEPRERVSVGYDGFDGEAHGGLTRPSCSRVKAQYPRGTEIRNSRQLTIVSVEEMEAVAADMGGPEPIKPHWIGANLMLRGMPDLTLLPPASRLIFEGGVAVTVDMQNGPCRFASELIEGYWPGVGLSFAEHARDRRGVTAWVEKTGVLSLGERCRLHIPPQRIYEPDAPARLPL